MGGARCVIRWVVAGGCSVPVHCMSSLLIHSKTWCTVLHADGVFHVHVCVAIRGQCAVSGTHGWLSWIRVSGTQIELELHYVGR